MSLPNEVVLRPRFTFNVNAAHKTVLALFEESKHTQKEFIISCVDHHVFIRIPKKNQHFWSPQLHLERSEGETQNSSVIRGLFGPNPTVLSLFMFVHFFVAVIFIGFGAWAYSNWSLENSFGLQIGVMFLMVLAWFILYFAGHLGKKAGMDAMHNLHHFMRDTLRSKAIHTLN